MHGARQPRITCGSRNGLYELNVISANISAALPDAPALAQAFARLARGEKGDLSQDLVALQSDIDLDETRAKVHIYCLGVDGMGWLRTDLLVEAICDQVVDYAIPRSKIREAVELCEKKGNQAAILRLAAEARLLFTHLKQTGEGGELLLYYLAEAILGFPQLIAKMHLKTAAAVHYHGADGVHASTDPGDGSLCLWWGESKLHESATDATRECIRSLAPFLIEPQSSSAKRARDLQLLRYGVDLDDELIEGAIKSYLDSSNPLYRKLKFGGLGLVGFNHECYPAHPTKADVDVIADQIALSSGNWKSGAGKHIAIELLADIDMHIFFLPFPSVEVFRSKVLKGVGIY